MALSSLADLKAENARAENAPAEPAADVKNADSGETELLDPQSSEEEATTDAASAESEDTLGDAESPGGDDDQTHDENWMHSDEATPPADKKYTGADIGAAKAKLRAKLETRHNSEIETLRAENETLKKGGIATTPSSKPIRTDFDNHDDPDDAYIEALTDWKIIQNNATRQAEDASVATSNKQTELKRETDQAVDQHYERAVILAAKSGIKPETYQAADLRVREMIESLFPNAGDVIADTLIARIGDGSEKVMYNLGVNQSRLAELKTRLQSDTSGMSAAMYLGQLSSELNAPRKKQTNAPKPAPTANGDKNADPSGAALKKKYDAAHKAGKGSDAFKLKLAAKKAGIKTAEW